MEDQYFDVTAVAIASKLEAIYLGSYLGNQLSLSVKCKKYKFTKLGDAFILCHKYAPPLNVHSLKSTVMSKSTLYVSRLP